MSDEAVTDAEREELVTALRRHVGEGRLDVAGFDERAARVYRAGTRAEARAALDGLSPLAGTAKGRRGGHGQSAAVAPHWVATDEVFRDPVSRVVMRVWLDPTDGSRHYVPS